MTTVDAGTARYRRAENVRMRPMGEWNGVLAYTPMNPNIYYLNRTCWIIVELCESKTLGELHREFMEFVADVSDGAEADAAFTAGLAMLEEKGIVELVS